MHHLALSHERCSSPRTRFASPGSARKASFGYFGKQNLIILPKKLPPEASTLTPHVKACKRSADGLLCPYVFGDPE